MMSAPLGLLGRDTVTFDMAELRSMGSVCHSGIIVDDSGFLRRLKAGDVAVVVSASFPLGMAVASCRLVETVEGLRLSLTVVNVLGQHRAPARHAVTVEFYEWKDEGVES